MFQRKYFVYCVVYFQPSSEFKDFNHLEVVNNQLIVNDWYINSKDVSLSGAFRKFAIEKM